MVSSNIKKCPVETSNRFAGGELGRDNCCAYTEKYWTILLASPFNSSSLKIEELAKEYQAVSKLDHDMKHWALIHSHTIN